MVIYSAAPITFLKSASFSEPVLPVSGFLSLPFPHISVTFKGKALATECIFQNYSQLLDICTQLVLKTAEELILSSVHWLPVHYRIQYKTLLLTWKGLNNMAPSYITELLSPYTPTRSLTSSDKSLLVVPRTKSFWVIVLFLLLLQNCGILYLLICVKLHLFIISSVDSKISYSIMPMSVKVNWFYYVLLYCFATNCFHYSMFLVKG